MKILCINTAFPTAQIACEFDEKKVFKEINAEAKSSENVLPAIENILSANNLTPENVTHIGVVTGPGSFTGLRIGVAIVKGFACVFPAIQIISVNSLDFMAFQYMQEKLLHKNECNCEKICTNEFQNIEKKQLEELNFQENKDEKKEFYCILNALSGRFFLAKFNEKGERVGECILTGELPKNAVLVGLEGENLKVATELIKLNPEFLLDFVKKFISEKKFISLEKLNPFYLRLSQAEENLMLGKIKK